MQATTARLKKILGVSSNRFWTPVYQRSYSWTTKQRRELWDDLVWAGHSGGTHFVGSVLLQDPDDGEGTSTSLTRYAVVDGQQRLVTLTILIHCLYERLKANPDLARELGVTPAGLRRQYVFDDETFGRDRYRLTPAEVDKPTLWHIVGDAPEPDRPSENILAAKADFDRWLLEEDPKVVWDGIGSLTAIDAKLTGDDDAQRIFESMNAKGFELSHFDMVRNWILMKVPAEHQYDFYNSKWLSFVRLLDEDPKICGAFLGQWLAADDPSDRHGAGNLYRTFKDRWRRRGWDSESAVAKLTEGARAWRCIMLGREDDPDLARAYRGVRRLNLNQMTPALLVLHRAMRSKTMSKADMIACCSMLESYMVRFTVLGGDGRSLSTMNDRIVRAVVGGERRKANIPMTVAANLLAPEDDDKTWLPRNDAFLKALKSDRLYRRRAQTARVVLEGIESAQHHNEPVDTASMTIEHIMPQTLGDKWPQDLGPGASEINDRWGDTLGNLTLTGSNSQLSNLPFNEKRSREGEGYEASPLWLNRSVAQCEHWGKAEIVARGEMLAEKALGIWPEPKAPRDMVDELRGKNGATLSNSHPGLIGNAAFDGLSVFINENMPDWRREVKFRCVRWSRDDRSVLTLTSHKDDGGFELYFDAPEGLDDPKRIVEALQSRRFSRSHVIRVAPGADIAPANAIIGQLA